MHLTLQHTGMVLKFVCKIELFILLFKIRIYKLHKYLTWPPVPCVVLAHSLSTKQEQKPLKIYSLVVKEGRDNHFLWIKDLSKQLISTFPLKSGINDKQIMPFIRWNNAICKKNSTSSFLMVVPIDAPASLLIL